MPGASSRRLARRRVRAVPPGFGEDRFGLCQSHACDRVYIDLTRNGSRRFCATGCSSRAETAAYRARRTTS